MSDFIPGIGPYDCPACGKKASAWGDGFCGQCEARYAEEMERQAEYERYGDPYLQEWGNILFMRAEMGQDYLKHPDQLPPVTEPEWAVGQEPHTIHGHRRETIALPIPEWVRQERVKAIDEAIEQYRASGTLNPPQNAERYIPCV